MNKRMFPSMEGSSKKIRNYCKRSGKITFLTITSPEYWKRTAVLLESFVKYGKVDWPVLILTKERLSKEARSMLENYGKIESLWKYGKIEDNPMLYKYTRNPRVTVNLQNPIRFNVPRRIFSCDGDVIVVDSLRKLEELEGNYAVFYDNELINGENYDVPQETRFNAGVMLYDGGEYLFNPIKEFFENYSEKHRHGEQVLLRLFFEQHPELPLKKLPHRYNRKWGHLKKGEPVTLYHFPGEMKPDEFIMEDHQPYSGMYRKIYRSLHGKLGTLKTTAKLSTSEINIIKDIPSNIIQDIVNNPEKYLKVYGEKIIFQVCLSYRRMS